MCFFEYTECSICSRSFTSIDDIVFSFVSCMHPVCSECKKIGTDIVYCGICNFSVPTEMAPVWAQEYVMDIAYEETSCVKIEDVFIGGKRRRGNK